MPKLTDLVGSAGKIRTYNRASVLDRFLSDHSVASRNLELTTPIN